MLSLALLGVAPAAHAQLVQSTNGLSITTPNGYAVVQVDDMTLASEAGAVKWGRQWDGQEWRFNPHWESLSQSWKNLTGSQSADTTGATVTSASALPSAGISMSMSGSGGTGGGCWVWVDEDWQPSVGTTTIGGLPQAAPMVAARLSPFNKVMGEKAAEYVPLQRVSVDYASLCAGSAMSMPTAVDVEGIRRLNELYLGDNGRYAFSNRSVLEKRAVRQLAPAGAASLYATLATGRMTLVPQTNDKGYRWIDKSGDWIDYNTQGQVVAYGDRNNNTVWMARDDGGRLLGVIDPRGRVLYTLHYTGELLTEVKDYPVAGLAGDLPARSVKYAYDDRNRLTEVTDVRGHKTKYDYNASNRLIKITDAEGRSETLAYTGDAVSKHVAADGGVTDVVFEYDDANKQFISKITGPQTQAGRRVEDLTHNRSGKLVRQLVNGRTETEVRYDTGARAEISTNARGFSTRTVRNEFEQVTQTVYPDGAAVRRVYSPVHLQQSEEVNQLGVRTLMERDTAGNLTKLIEAAGTNAERVREFEVNTRGQVTRMIHKGRTEANGSVTPDAVWQIEHDEMGGVAKITDPEGHAHRYVQDRLGRLRAYVDPLGNETRYDVDAAGEVTKVTDALGRATTIQRDKVSNVVSIVDARSKRIQASYDALNRPLTVTNTLGGVQRFQYNLQGLRVQATDEDGRSVRAEFDNFLRLVSQKDGLDHETRLGYDVADGSAGGALGSLQGPTEIRFPTAQLRQRYDALERPTRSTLANPGKAGTTESETSQTYDARGRLASETDEYGKTRRYAYDELDRVVSFTDTLGAKTTFTYDTRDNVLEVKDANGNVYGFNYDRKNQVTKEILPLGQSITHVYDGAGNQTSKTDRAGRVTKYRYDAANRLIEARHLGADEAPLRTTSYTWDEEGRMLTWRDEDHVREQTMRAQMTYDDAGRKATEAVTYPDGHVLTYAYAHSLAGKRTQITYPDGTAITHAYSAHGQWESTDIPGEGRIAVNQFKWVTPSRVTLPGGSVQDYTLNGMLMLEDLKVKATTQQVVLAIANTWGKQQELQTSLRTDVLGASSSTRTSRYDHDSELRLIRAELDTGGLFGTDAETFTLDPVANRLAHSKVSGAWTYDANNQLKQRGEGSQAATYVYDEAGNVVQKTEPGNLVTRYRYDVHNRLIEVLNGSNHPVARYGYDPQHRRVWKEQYRDRAGQPLPQAVRTLYLYGEEGLLAEAQQGITLAANLSVSAVGAPTVRTIYGWQPDSPWGTRPLFIRTPNTAGETVYAYYHRDHLETPMLATDKAGRVVWSAVYHPFGRATITAPAATSDMPTVQSNLRLPGQYEDVETGLHYNFHRFYEPESGRYLQSDPIALDGGINTYGYVNGNPLRFTDPYGLFGMDDVWGGVYWATGGWEPSQGTVDAITGFGDGISVFGFSPSRAIREGWGINGGVDKCSPEYRAASKAGGWYTAMLPVAGRLGYITRVAAIPRSVSTVEAAYAARAAVKSEYRSIFRSVINAFDRDPKLSDILAKAAAKGDAYAIARTGVTNKNWNVGILGSAAANIGRKMFEDDDDCACRR